MDEKRRKAIIGKKPARQPCAIYRSSKKNNSYLYVENREDFSRVPTKLLEMLGKLDFVMQLDLHSGISLAQADTQKVIAMLQEKGYFLQLPLKEYQSS